MRNKEIIFKIGKGQSTLEYIIILAVVIAAVIGVATAFKADIAKVYNAVYGP